MAHPALGGIGRAFSNRNYRVFTVGSALSQIGGWVQRAAAGWLAWEITHDPFWVGIVASGDLLPAVISSPFAGVLADRHNRVRLLVILQALLLVHAVVTAALSFAGLLSIETLLALTVVLGVFTGFNHPARQSIITSLVRREDLSAAVAMSSVLFNVTRIVGPSIAGFLIHFGEAGAAFGFVALTYGAMLVSLALVRLADEAPPPRVATSVFTDILAGYRYAFRHRGIGPMLILSLAAAFLLRPVLELLPAFVGKIYEGGADLFGLMMAMTGIGATVSGIWLAWRGADRGLVTIAIWGSPLSVIALLGLAGSHDVWVGIGSVVLMGVSMSLRGTSVQTLMQNAVDPQMRGRVMSLNTLIFNGGPAAGAFLLGSVASWAGLQPPLYVAAALTLIVWLWSLRIRPQLMASFEPESTRRNE
ncbi:MAG: MFS transporter [Alphaproteobacteria bacterium]|nr:MFS transporter [Alphaproteobacteria bacterium]